MRKRLVSPWIRIIGLCIVGFLINGIDSSRVIAQSQPEEPRTQWQKIVVIPFFKGRRGAADAGDNVSCPIRQDVVPGTAGEEQHAGDKINSLRMSPLL